MRTASSQVAALLAPQGCSHGWVWIAQGYAIGNPSTDGSTTYNLNGVYAGFNLISAKLTASLDANECPESYNNFNQSDGPTSPESNATAGLDGGPAGHLLPAGS